MRNLVWSGVVALLMTALTALPALAQEGVATDLPALQKRFAPVIVQTCHGRADTITKFDFDGNWNGDDDWENFDKVQNLPATVYTSAIETKTHVFLTYSLFHPRDWLPVSLPLISHENDLEGVLVVVEKGAPGSSPSGAVVTLVETFAHYHLYRYAVDRAQAGGRTDGTVRFEGEHPIVRVEGYKHGIYAYQEPTLAGAKGVIYRYKGVAGVPKSRDDKDVGYDFQTIESTFWARRNDVGRDKLFSTRGTYALGSFGANLSGTRYANDRAAAPWNWLDSADKGLAKGDWFFDPALAMQAHYPARKDRFSREYTVNPFLFNGATARDAERSQKFALLAALD